MQLSVVLLFLLSSHVVTVTAWAGCHRDRDKDHRSRENCTALGFSDVVAGFEPTTKVMLFPNNLFSRLSWSSFQIFTKIYEIDLTGNKIPEVTSSVTPMLPTLSVLRLGSNRLTSLSDNSFSACPALTELYLENNAVHSLSDHTFSGLSKLEILDLSSNHIKVLPELMLHPLRALETLYLEKNEIRVMPDDWFSKKEEVPYLYLSANPWACFCSLGYLRSYLDDYELNVYVRDGPIIKGAVESVVCASPQRYKDEPVINLEESDLCTPATESGPAGDNMLTTVPGAPTPIPTTPFPTTPIPTTPTPTTTIPTTSTPTTTIPTTTIPTTSTPTTTIPTTPIPTPATAKELYTEYHRVVTWYQTFTGVTVWSDQSGSGVTDEVSLVPSRTFAPHPSVGPSTESPANVTPATPKPRSVPSTVTSTTQKLRVATTTATDTSTPSGAISEVGSGEISAVVGARVFCFWLFAGCLLLCVASAVCILATLASMILWYRRVYKPLSVMLARRGGSGEVVRLLTYSRRDEKEVAGGGGGVMALYRSVLYIHREGREAVERKEGEVGGEGGNNRLLVPLEPTGGGGGVVMREEEGQSGGREERGVYRKTLYRLLSKEEEMDGWRDVMEECRVSADDGGRRQGEGRGGAGVTRKCYSLILREEREEAGGGREELDWVVGGWEVKRGEGGEDEGGVEAPRSSWGEWLDHYLPSMPWSVTTPPEGDAAH